MRVAHTGTPRTKFCVPSIGSITHCLAAVPVEPSSSPIIPSRVRTRESCARRSSSTSRSTSVTGVPSLLCSTVKDRSLNRDMLTRSTLSARICASLKSSVYDVVKFMNLSSVVKCYRVWSMPLGVLMYRIRAITRVPQALYRNQLLHQEQPAKVFAASPNAPRH